MSTLRKVVWYLDRFFYYLGQAFKQLLLWVALIVVGYPVLLVFLYVFPLGSEPGGPLFDWMAEDLWVWLGGLLGSDSDSSSTLQLSSTELQDVDWDAVPTPGTPRGK